MGSVAIKASPALGSLLRSKRKEARLSLRQVSERLAAQGQRIPTSTLARIEQGQLDPGVIRLLQLLRLYEVPSSLVADLIELEELAVEPPTDEDLETLYSKGVAYWKQGDIAQGLAYLFAVRQYVPADEASQLLRQKATLTFAVAARNLGKLKLARELLHELLCQPPDPSLIVEVFVLSASVWLALGSHQVALAFVREAAESLQPEEKQKKAWVFHQQAKLLVRVGRVDEAEHTLNHALELYRGLDDTYGEARALILKAEVLEARGQPEEALRSARETLGHVESHGHARLVVMSLLELGRLLLKARSVDEGIAMLRRALGQAVTLGDRNAEFLAHYYLWKAHESLGDLERARFELEAAKFFVRSVDDSSPEANEVRTLLT